jgi:uncharacterized membrane protein YfcA
MDLGQIGFVLAGALVGGFVSGLTGFGTGITAMGIWLHAISPPVAASLVIICSVVSHLQTLPLIWRSIEWARVLPYTIPGLLGIPIGTFLLPLIDQRAFKIGVGMFLAAYSTYVLARKSQMSVAWGGRSADGAVGFGGGIMGGLTGFSGVLPIIWTDIRGLSKEHRRSILQGFNLIILSVALASHAAFGLITPDVGLATAAALPGTLGGAWGGAVAYRRLGERAFQDVIMVLLLVSGVSLIWSSA